MPSTRRPAGRRFQPTGDIRKFRLDELIGALPKMVAEPVLDALGWVSWTHMPVSIRDAYQYFTQAETANLRRAGFTADFASVEEGVKRYVSGYLDRADRHR